jgi:hypothetical protein
MREPPIVKRGQPITAALWNQFAAAVRACRIISGDGVRLRETPDGTIISFDGGGAEFAHPFQVALIGTEAASIRPGTVNRVEAKIKDVPLAGKDGEAPPLLKFGKPKLDDEGRGYICVEVTCREKDWSVEKVEVVQVADPNTDDGEAGEGHSGSTGSVALPGRRTRYPLAMLRERDDGKLDLYQITFFDLQHRAALGEDRKTATRHFFWQ